MSGLSSRFEGFHGSSEDVLQFGQTTYNSYDFPASTNNVYDSRAGSASTATLSKLYSSTKEPSIIKPFTQSKDLIGSKKAKREAQMQEKKREKDEMEKTNKRIETIESFLSTVFPQWQNFAQFSEAILIMIRNARPSPPGSTPTHPPPSGSTPVASKGVIATNWTNDQFTKPMQAALKKYKYSLIFGTHTEFNPSGIWVVQDCYNDMDE